MVKKSGSGSGMNNPDHISESLKNNFLGLNTKILYADPGWKNRIRDLEWKNLDPGSWINIPDP
jgi:hypothetical protein